MCELHEFVNSKDDNGSTILHLAVLEKQVEVYTRLKPTLICLFPKNYFLFFKNENGDNYYFHKLKLESNFISYLSCCGENLEIQHCFSSIHSFNTNTCVFKMCGQYTGFVASLSIILLLVSGLPFIKRRFFIWILIVITWTTISSMAAAYLVMVYRLSDKEIQVHNYVLYVMIGWVCFEGIHLLAHIVRLTKRIVKYLIGKMKKRRGPASSSSNEHADHTV